uniref:hypothetical protein n=1 Tax=Ndongobacter massiliensis TaxID=1871025 RepID=UPI0013900C7F|nr:hypothetical protein [Ndongobacter massiliensis]
MGVETTLEQGLALSVVQKAVNRGDVKALQTICQILGENITTGDKQEQRARIQKLEAETRKINAEIERAKDRDGEKDTQVVIVDEWSEEDESKDCTDTTGD